MFGNGNCKRCPALHNLTGSERHLPRRHTNNLLAATTVTIRATWTSRFVKKAAAFGRLQTLDDETACYWLFSALLL